MKHIIRFLLLLGYISILIFSNSPSIQAADISFPEGGWYLKIDGKIEKGDYAKFMDKLSQIYFLKTAEFPKAMERYRKNSPIAYKEFMEKYNEPKGVIGLTVYLNSQGGDVAEAVKIGKTVRDLLLPTETGFHFIYGGESKDNICMSSCFLIWVSGIEREVGFRKGRNPLGIHRLYFDSKYYSGLPPDEAEKKYSQLMSFAKDHLRSMGVPDEFFVKIFSVPSNEVYLLSDEEISRLEGKAPFYEELLFSKCGSFTKQEEEDYKDCWVTVPYSSDEDRQSDYYKRIVAKCQALSPGYLNYIKKKVEQTRSCWTIQGRIMRWERMHEYFSKTKHGRQ